MAISWQQFGPLYHGTSVRGLETIHQGTNGGPRYPGMRDSWGWNYTTTDLELAKQYAHDAARMDSKKNPNAVPVVYEVHPERDSYVSEGRRYRHKWGPDPDSGPFGYGDGPRNRREAFDLHDGGSPVSLRFEAPLKATEVWSHEDNS
jgi:hypothetical protein